MTRALPERAWRLFIVLVGLLTAAAVVTGRLASGPTLVQAALLSMVTGCVGVLAYRRLRGPASLFEDAALGGLLLCGAYALAEPAGGVNGPLHPLVYLVMAFVVANLSAGLTAALTALAVGLESLAFVLAGPGHEKPSTLLVHAGLLVAFAVLHRLVLAAQVAGGKAAGSLALRDRMRDMEERARAYRLLSSTGEEEVDKERWLAAAVREVEEAVNNALEVAEVALATHTIGVFLVHGDDRLLRLNECRSLADDVRRTGFDAREGILGAALKRRVPMRLCGELKGVTWYQGNTEPRSVLVMPLLDRRGAALAGVEEGWLRGLLLADRLTADPFTENDERLLEATAREVLRAIEIERVMGTIKKAQVEKDRFYRTIEELNLVSKPQEVVATALKVARDVAALDLLALTTVSEEEGVRLHRVEGVLGPQTEALQGLSFQTGTGLCENVVRYGTTLPGRELRKDERPQIFDEGTEIRGLQSLRIVPLRAGDQILGTLVCGSRKKGALDADAVRLLEVIAMQAAQSLSRARLFAETERLAVTDGLTGLYNRRTFQSRLDEELARAARAGRKVTLVMVDVDHFKAVNDTYGHGTGDKVLQGIARILTSCARTTDLVARIGGEELALILPETDAAGGKLIAERVREAVAAQSFATDLGPLRCTVSLGVASWPGESRDKKDLMEKADACLYHCKRMGRNRSATVEEASFEGRLRAAGEA